MTDLFLKVINMSISASWLVLAVLVLRLFLKKAPKWSIVTLWGIVAVRLMFPFSIESALSLIPSAETVAPEIMTDTAPAIQSGIPVINNTVNSIISQNLTPATQNSVNPFEVFIPALAVAWVLGAILIFVYTTISAITLRVKIGSAVRLSGNVFQSEYVKSPFVMGVFMPKIYVPFNMDSEAAELIIAHEQSHLRRKDHWWKPLGFLLLTVHWFNPLMWVAYAVLCKDIELACDERVIKSFDNEKRADYSRTLLEYSVNRGAVTACPLAFGEVGVKARIKSVLNYKKPAFWLVIASLIICIGVGVCFLTNPVSEPAPVPDETVKTPVADETTKKPVSNENPETSVSNEDPTTSAADKTPSLPPLEEVVEGYEWFQSKEDGSTVKLYDDLQTPGDETDKAWINFVNASYSGNPAFVRIRISALHDIHIEGYDNDAYWIKDLSFDGKKYTLQYYENGKLITEEYKYLVRFGSVKSDNNSYDNYLLTDTPADKLSQKDLAGGNYKGNLIYSVQVPRGYVQNTCFGSVYINFNGINEEEKCSLGTDPSISTPNFTLTFFPDYHPYELGYQNIFEANYDSVCFVWSEDGEPMVQTVKNGDEPEIHTYEIVPIYGDKVGLMENGKALKSLNVF